MFLEKSEKSFKTSLSLFLFAFYFSNNQKICFYNYYDNELYGGDSDPLRTYPPVILLLVVILTRHRFYNSPSSKEKRGPTSFQLGLISVIGLVCKAQIIYVFYLWCIVFEDEHDKMFG